MNLGRRPINTVPRSSRDYNIILTEDNYKINGNTLTSYFSITVSPGSNFKGNVVFQSNLFQSEILYLNGCNTYSFSKTYQLSDNYRCISSSSYLMIDNRIVSNTVNNEYCKVKSNGISINLGDDTSILMLNIQSPSDNILIPIRGRNLKMLRNPHNAFEINSGSIILSRGSRLLPDRKYILVLEVCGFEFQPTIIYSSSYNGNFNPNMQINMQQQMLF